MANFFAFLGLVFEIAGTFIGAIHSILLQRRSKNKSLLPQKITLLKADLRVILKLYIQKLQDERQQAEELRRDEERRRMRQAEEPQVEKIVDNIDTLLSIVGGRFNVHSDSEDRKERLQRVETFIQEIQHHPLSSSQGFIIDAVMNVLHELSSVPSPDPKNKAPYRQSTYRTLDIVPSAMRPMFTFGIVPLISMAVGAAFLAISTILLAAASEVLASEVWIGCIGVLVVVMTLSLLPFRYARSLHPFPWV